MTAPLAGTRVVELCRYISGPYAGKLLGDLGADVIKVEDPPTGDPFRGWQSTRRSFSPQFSAYNSNKRSIVLDLKNPVGRDVLLRAISSADVLLENFRPRALDRLGLGWEVLSAANPRLIQCSITGFGPDGPYAGRPSYDSVASSVSGLYSMIFPPDHPVPVGPPMADLVAGLFASQSVLAALVGRGAGGRGQKLDVSMLGAMLGFLVEPASTWLNVGDVYEPDSRPRRAQVYALVAGDDLPFIVHLSTPDKFWHALARVVDRPDLIDDERFGDRHRRYENYYELDVILKTEVRKQTRTAWFERLEAADIPFAPIYRMNEVFDDPHVRHMALEDRVPMDGEEDIRLLRHPVRFADDSRQATPPPRLGQQTDEILGELGYGAQEVATMRQVGAFG